MKKLAKILCVVLAMALVASFAVISTFAAEPASITVLSAPDKTVYIDGVDNWENEIWCDPTGMVLEVTFDDGTTEEITVDEYSYVDMYVVDYAIGENEATVDFYGTDDYDTLLSTTCTVTVVEAPIASVEITKMPDKTEYTMDDVLTRDNFSFDKLYEMDPETFDAAAAELGMTFEELKEFYESDPEFLEFLMDILFADCEEMLLIDTSGMEILVTFTDGTTQTITDEDAYVLYNDAEIPVYLEQVSPTVEEGENEFVLTVGNKEVSFTVTVVGEDDGNGDEEDNTPVETPEKNPDEKPNDDIKNPVIPNTDGGASVVALAVISLASGLGVALVPSRKRK